MTGKALRIACSPEGLIQLGRQKSIFMPIIQSKFILGSRHRGFLLDYENVCHARLEDVD